jgi:hypothetical protein
MSYSTSNPPVMLLNSIDGGGAPRFWLYKSTDSDATVYAAGYFTNGLELGMQKGDVLFFMKTDTPELYIHVCTVATTDALLAFGSSPSTSS